MLTRARLNVCKQKLECLHTVYFVHIGLVQLLHRSNAIHHKKNVISKVHWCDAAGCYFIKQ